MYHFVRLLSAIFLVAFVSIHALGQSNCVLRKDQDSIKVYTCSATESKFKSIKATFSLHVPMSRLVGFVMDVPNYMNWQYNTIEARKILKVSEFEFVSYTQIEAPWPVSNRDMVTRFVVTQDSNTQVVTIKGRFADGIVPIKKDIVRVPMAQAQWIITPAVSGRLDIVYTILIDPGGSVPAWMINMVSAEAPFVSFRNLKNGIGSWSGVSKAAGLIKDQ